jgi:hypothetical protein
VKSPLSNDLGASPSIAGPQFAQLIYTSFDDGSSLGGWQVKAETGDLTAAERQALTSRIVTRFDVGAPLPTYPTPEEIAGRPARLAYASLAHGSAGYWHTVDAGRDGTGRPGNVMAHVMLDRSVRTPSPLRPIQLWGSPKWLRPYGAADVAAATLTDADLPEPSAETSVASVVSFLTGTTVDRQSVFRVLLDAVYATMAGGPGVMLVTRDLTIGPKWIAAVSYFMSPGAARRFSWCTHDDPTMAVADLRRGTNLVVVDEDGAKKAAGGQWVVIDDAEEPGIGELGSMHRTTSGDVAVTGWSVLAEGALESYETATRLIAAQDAVAAAIGDYDVSPAWPLAVAVRRDPALAEYHRDADQLVADEQPAHANAVDWVAEVVAEALAATAPADAHESFMRLTRAHRRGLGLAPAARSLLHNALTDRHWLASGPVAEVPSVNVIDAEPLQPLIAGAVTMIREVYPESDSVEALHLAVRAEELLRRLCSPGPELNNASVQVRELITTNAGALADGRASNVLCVDTAIGVATREEVLRPAVAGLALQTRFRIGLGVWTWLFGHDRPNPAVPDNPHPSDRTLLAHYILAALQDPHQAALPGEAGRLAADGAFLALDAADLGDADCRTLIDSLALVEKFDGADLGAMFVQWPHRISPRVACAPIYYRQVPDELVNSLANRLEEPDDIDVDRAAMTAARLRMLHRGPRSWTTEQVDRVLIDAERFLVDDVPAEHMSTVATELVEVLGIALVIGQIRGVEWADMRSANVAALAGRLTANFGPMVDTLAELTKTGVLDIGWFAGRALLQRIDGVDTASLVGDHTDGKPALADAVVAALIEQRSYTGPVDVAGLRDCAWEHVRALDAQNAERFFDGYSRAARDWLHAKRIGGDNGLRLGFLRPNF